MPHRRKRIAVLLALLIAAVLAVGPRAARAYDPYDTRSERYEERHPRNYNDEYIFSTTRMVSEMDVHPALKVPLFPPAIVIDLVFLPAEVIAGMF
jgi:hypothetical protein